MVKEDLKIGEHSTAHDVSTSLNANISPEGSTPHELGSVRGPSQPNRASRALEKVEEYRPSLAQVINAHGSLTLDAYFSRLFPPGRGASEQLCAVIQKVAQPIYGEALTEQLCQQLRECGTVNSANHCGPFFQENTFQSLLLSARGAINAGHTTLPVFAATIVPLEISDFPRGIIWNGQKVGIFPAAHKNVLVHSCPPCTSDQLGKVANGTMVGVVTGILKKQFPEIDENLSASEQHQFWLRVQNGVTSRDFSALNALLGCSNSPVADNQLFIQRTLAVCAEVSDKTPNRGITNYKVDKSFLAEVLAQLKTEFPEVQARLGKQEAGAFWSKINVIVGTYPRDGAEKLEVKLKALMATSDAAPTEDGLGKLRRLIDVNDFRIKLDQALEEGKKAEQDVRKLVINRIPTEIFDRQRFPLYTDQVCALNSALWREGIKHEAGTIELMYLPVERICAGLIREDLLHGEDQLLRTLLLDPAGRERALTLFEGIQGAWDSVGVEGTHFFWGISAKGRMVSLRVAGDKLVGSSNDEKFEIPLTAKDLAGALETGRIAPGILLTMTSLIQHGVTPLGGYNQVDYAGMMHERMLVFRKEFSIPAKYSTNSDDVRLNDILYGPGVILTQYPSQAVKIAGPDIFLRDPEKMAEAFARSITTHTLREGMILGVIEESFLEVVPSTERKDIEVTVGEAAAELGISIHPYSESARNTNAAAPFEDTQSASALHAGFNAQILKAVTAPIERVSPAEFDALMQTRVGNTPLVTATGLGTEYSLKNLYLKLEGGNFTSTAKDRIAYAEVRNALEQGYEGITVASCGNFGVAIAHAAMVAGMRAHVYVQKVHLPREVNRMREFGADVVIVDGDYEAAVAASRRKAGDAIYDSNPGGANSKIQMQAYAPIAREIVSELGDAPHYVAVPVGSGTVIAGIYQGFVKLHAQGESTRIPAMVGGSVQGMNAVVLSLLLKLPEYRDISPDKMQVTTTSAPLATWQALDGQEAFSAIRESSGFVMQFSDKDLERAQELLLAKEGILAIPGAIAGLQALLLQHSLSLKPTKPRPPLEPGNYVAIITANDKPMN